MIDWLAENFLGVAILITLLGMWLQLVVINNAIRWCVTHLEVVTESRLQEIKLELAMIRNER